GRTRLGAVDIIADRQGRPLAALLPMGAEGGAPGLAAFEAPGLVGALEAAIAEPAEHHVAADPEHDQVGSAVAVDAERIGAGDVVQLEPRVGNAGKAQRSADRALVAIEAGLGTAAGDVEIGQSVAVAVEGRHAAADEIFPAALVAGVDAGGAPVPRAQRRGRPPRPPAP